MDQVETQVVDMAAAPTLEAPVAPLVPVPGFTGDPGNFTKDMAALAAELEPAPVAPVEAPANPAPPETTESATAPVPVPDKFKDAEGNLDQAKLEKSTADAQAALTKYLATEKELRKKMNEVSGLKNAAPSIAPAAPAQSTFAAQLEADMQKYGAGEVMARLFEAAKETAKKEVLSDVEADREERREIKSRRELEDIGKYDQEVLTPAGLDRLAQIRAERPYLNSADNPTQAAYEVYLAEQVKKSRQTGTVLPTPKGPTAKAPPTPVGPAPRAVVQIQAPKLESKSDIDAHLATLNPEQEAKFWKSRNLRF